ncbi:related to ABC transporter [Ustilago trichophora]|uniref:Related to ABC transporter n=1 Tax=Ustilago trichophora TaxID=86804 RepID=A0A5C3DUI2_9BASI|nr:related to ABC transporter [Ustilago trichophora]
MVVCNDGVFTPVSDCRFFDFTITFSNSIFVILPSCIGIVLILARLVRIRRKPDIPAASTQPTLSLLRSCAPHSDPISLFGAFVYVANAVLSLVLVALLAAPSSHTLKHAMDDRTGMPSVVLPFIAALLAIPLSVAERRKTRGGNMVLPLWLLLTLLFNACRIRTFNAIPDIRQTSFFYVYVLAFACQALMLTVENAKAIRSTDVNSTHESRASFFSRLLFIWVFPLLWAGFRKPLELDDLDSLKPEFYGRSLANSFIASWTGVSIETNPSQPPEQFDGFGVAEVKQSPSRPSSEVYPLEKLALSQTADSATSRKAAPLFKGSSFPKRQVQRGLLHATLRAFPVGALAPVPWRLLLTATELAQPFLVSTTLHFVQTYSGSKKGEPVTPQPVVYGWGLVGAYAFVYLGQTLATGQYWYTSSQLMTKVRGALVEAIYRKGLNLHLRTARTSGGGKAANLMSVDTERVVKAIDVVHSLWSGTISIGIGIFLLYSQLGFVFFASLAAIVLCFFLTPLASRGIGTKQGAWSSLADKRVNLTTSVTSDIKGVKFSAYEDILHAKICKARAEELVQRSNMMKQLTVIVTWSNATGEMLGLCTFVTLFVVDRVSGSNRFDLNTVFTTLTIIKILQMPLLQLGQQYSFLLQAWASMKRIEAFLNSEDKPDVQAAVDSRLAAQAPVATTGCAAKFKNADLGWGEEVVLSDVNLEIPVGALTMICGRLGQGKSTLLQAILGESDLIKGQQQLPLLADRVAYVSQDVWLQEKRSIRDNIIFATGEYDEERYITALRACALTEDIESLQEGDATTASALSGGQRQRVAVARAVYSDAETFIFDDVTSALDAETAAHMWRSLMGPAGLLKGKTTIFATNAVHLLHHAQYVVRIEGGKIAEQGRYEDLSMKGKDAISRASLDSQRAMPAPEQPNDTSVKTGAVEKQEAVLTGSVGWRVYSTWFKAAGLKKIYFFFSLCVLGAMAVLAPSYYLQAWSQAQQEHRFKDWGAWMAGYMVLEPMAPLFLFIGFWILHVNCSQSAGNKLHDSELKGVLSAPISFFSKWSSGQITNRFSQDLFQLDQVYPNALTNTAYITFSTVAALITMCIPAPYLSVLGVALIAISWAIQRLYIPSSRQLRRLEMAAKSPLYSLFSETSSPAGLATVRGLKREASLVELNSESLDVSQTPYYHLFVVRRWLQTWLLLLTTTVNVALVLLVVVLRHSSQAGLFGVALVQATELGILLNQTVISFTEIEIAGVALERVREFSEIEPEGAARPKQLDGKDEDETEMRGDIEFDKVTVSYGPELQPAVKELSFDLPAGKRLGIVGRSGSGKSTTLLALFRMIEMRSGTIRIDGQSISEMAARKLRSQMTIVPQNPLVLAATIRENLDPEGVCTDDELWGALQKCHLAEFVKKQENKLDEVLLTGDSFISSGQKQLLSLARALLRKRKILVLDEATSAMDVETDAAVQNVLSTQFPDCTVIAVAHRIATIIDFDQIICMSAGRAIETGSPEELLKKRGEFWALAAEQKCV